MLVGGMLGLAIFAAALYAAFVGAAIANNAFPGSVFYAIVGAGFTLALLFIYRLGTKLLADGKVLREVSDRQHLTREQIVDFIDRLSFEMSMRRLLPLLSRPDVTVQGDWPKARAPLVGSGYFLTELAKLDERWLRLDR